MKRPVKIVRALFLALVISSGITPIYATSIVEVAYSYGGKFLAI